MTRPALTLLLLATLGACATPDPTLYTLDRVAPASPIPASQGEAIALHRIAIPDYADRPQIVRATDRVRVEKYPNAHWAGALDTLLTSALAADLRATLPGATIIDTTGPIPAPANAIPLSVQITRLGTTKAGAAVLIAEYTLGTGQPPRTLRLHAPMATDSAYAYATAIDAMLGTLATRIAQATIPAR